MPTMKIPMDKLCPKCLNEELVKEKHQREEAILAEEQLAHQRYLDQLKQQEEELKAQKAELLRKQREETQNYINSSAKKKPIDNSQEKEINEKLNEEYEKLRASESAKKSQEAQRYREELRQQMENKKKAAEDAKNKDKTERPLTGYEISGGSMKGPQQNIQDYRRDLQRQMEEKQRKRSDNYGDEKLTQSQIDEYTAKLEKEKALQESEKKKNLKETYETGLKDREIRAKQAAEEKAKELEILDKQRKRMDNEQEEERKRELEKKKVLSKYLADQIQEKEAIRQKEKIYGEPQQLVEEKSGKPMFDSSKEAEKKAVINDNLRMIQEKAAQKAKAREQEKQLEAEYIRKQQELEEQERAEALRKKEMNRKSLQNELTFADKKKLKEMQDKNAKKDELDYYESLNSQLKDLVKKEKEEQKGKLSDYKNTLEAQIAAREAAKKKQREEELAGQNQGFDMEEYKGKPSFDKQKYKEELERQRREGELQKSAGKREDIELIEKQAKMNEIAEKLKEEQQKEERNKKAQYAEEYRKSMEAKEKNRKDANLRASFEKQQLEEAAKSSQAMVEQAKNEEENKKKLLRDYLGMQLEHERAKKARERSERNEWADEKGKQQLEEIEKKMATLKTEIERCIKCNAPLPDRNKVQTKYVKEMA